jgi:Na+/proline symporter
VSELWKCHSREGKFALAYFLCKNLINKMLQNQTWRCLALVYCPKCGTKNEDTATFCIKCGASLQTGTYTSRRYERRRAEGECFGLPHGGAIAGIVIGLIIMIWGVLLLGGWGTSDFWIVIIIIIGILMIAGAAYRLTRPRPAQPPPP